MAIQYDITVRIKFNEHDNERLFISHLLNYLTRLKHDVEKHPEVRDSGNPKLRHEDIYFDMDITSMYGYMTDQQKTLYLRGFKNFLAWNIIYSGKDKK